jgi:2-keto-4-pentenoate hydratase/2-oxohepta-3-ene-1,7-dioic acid hydratase in catechol pathway
MKFGSYTVGGKASYGIVTDKGIIDLTSKLGKKAPTLRDLIALEFDGADDIASNSEIDFEIGDVEWLPVIPDPGAVWCCGLNTHSHFHETKHIFQRDAPPDVPMFFLRSRHTLVASGQAIEKPALETDFDYEGEVALVIGKRCRNVSVEDALQHVAGYSCFNDGSARQYQIRSHQVTTGKNAYHSGGFGPWMVTTDEIGLDDMELETRVNGEVRQQMRMDDLIFSCADLISHISEVTWLEPGDVIVTGSPEGAGALRDPQVFLKEGDVVEVEVSGIGTLTNPVIEQKL